MSSQESHDPWPTTPVEAKAAPAAPLLLPDDGGVARGDHLGSYELLAPLGKGGMGMVFRARHLRLKKEFALKVLSPRLARDGDAIRRFERETEALGRLEHINLVRASDAGVEKGVPFLVMELLDGANLAELTKQRGAWPIAEACEAVRQAALGLQHASERGLVHRDIKPSNLWLAPDGAVKVLDMGLARLCGEEGSSAPMTAAGVWMGTPDYIAPEQILDSHTADIRADLYSLGCTLFHLLTGEPPFGPSTHPELRHKSEAHLKEPPPNIRQRRSDLPAGLASVLARLLAKRPEERYSTPAQAAAALVPFAANARLGSLLGGDVPSTVDLSTRSEVVPETASNRLAHRWYWGAAAAVVLIGSIGLGVHLSHRSETPTEQSAVTAAPEKLHILQLDVTHYPTANGRPDVAGVRVLGKGVFSTNLDDSVTVKGRLSRPAYAFLIAFRPDGTWEVCFPEKDDEPPPLTDKPAFPWDSAGFNYGLKEGAGLHAFALAASSQPLPSFKDWWAKHPGCPWKKNETPPGIVWRGDGIDDVEPLAAELTRGVGSKIAVPGKTPVAQLAKWLRTAPQIETVQVLGFAVMPKE